MGKTLWVSAAAIDAQKLNKKVEGFWKGMHSSEKCARQNEGHSKESWKASRAPFRTSQQFIVSEVCFSLCYTNVDECH